MNRIILEGHDRSPQAAAGDNLVAGLERIQHRRPLLLAALLGKDQEKIKDRKNKNQRGNTEPPHSTASLHCQQKMRVHLISFTLVHKRSITNSELLNQPPARYLRTTAYVCSRHGPVISRRG